jgi:peptidoglycan/xylan/chitin deacetylase (PgdA/CDA1 family)
VTRRERTAQLLSVSGVGTLLRRLGRWPGALVLAYHRIGDASSSPYDRASFSATAEEFDAQLAVLAREADVIGAGDVRDTLGRRGRHVAITFDDGYRDAYEAAYPLLRAHRLTATFFLSTGFLDEPRLAWWDEISWMVRASPRRTLPAGGWLSKPLNYDEPGRVETVRTLLDRYKSLPGDRTGAFLDFLAEATSSGRPPSGASDDLWMDWDMVREMLAGGMSVGGHSVTHPVLARLPRREQADEIRGCAERIATEARAPMRLFSYPVGLAAAFNADTRACLREAGVELAFSLYGSAGRLRSADPLDVPRTSVGPGATLDAFAALLTLPGRFARW